jgi:hypothetical protein
MGAKAGTNKAMQQQPAGAQTPPQSAPAPAAAPAAASAEGASDRISQLKQLADLHSSGALTDEEFAAEKAKILG